MKNVFFIAFMFLNGFIAYGQVEKPILKGNYSIGGSIGYSVTSETTDKFDDSYNREFNFSPSIGYFFFDRITLGISPVISFRESSNNSYQHDDNYSLGYKNSSTIKSLGLAPFVKYYFKNGIFGTANIQYAKNWGVSDNKMMGFRKIDNSNIEDVYSETHSDYDYRSLGWGLGLGYAYFINSKVSVDCSLNYHREKQIRSGASSSSSSNSKTLYITDISRELLRSNYFLSLGLSVFL